MTGQAPMETVVHEPEPESDGDEPIVIRIGFVIAGGVLSALLSSVPASLRLGEGGSIGRALEQWVVLSAVATPLAVAAVAVLRRARVGVQLLTDREAEPMRLFAMGVLWWSVLELTLLAMFGALLRKTTHHHALAGVTFAVFAVVSGILVALFARRTTVLLAGGGASVQRVALGIAGGCALVGLLVLGVRLARAEGMHAGAGLVDVLVFVLMTTLASTRVFARWRPLAIAGAPVAVLVMMLGLSTLRFEPALRQIIADTAPIHALVIALFGSG